MRTFLAVALVAGISILAGCGVRTVSFTRKPRPVHLRVGDELGVRKSVGECGSPWSTAPSVIRVENPPPVGDCAQEAVTFKAIKPGAAQIRGALPCHFTECAAMAASIPVTVTRN